MAVSLNSNTASTRAVRRLDEGTQRLARTFERLSSGQRINRASDDAAGLAISSALSADSRVYTQAIRNANDGISALNIAGSAVGQLSSVLTRIRELAIQSANGSFSLTQRRSINKESEALTKEYNRLVATTKFNGVQLLSGSSGQIGIQLGYGLDGLLRISSGSGVNRTVGSGTFQGATNLGISVAQNDLAVGDLNGDGKDDIVRANSPISGGGISVSINDGSGGFATKADYATGSSNTIAVHLADINGDGKLDILSTIDDRAIGINLGNGDGTFKAATSIIIGTDPVDIQTADMSGDGKVDLVAGNGLAAYILLGNGDGTFRAALTTSGNFSTFGIGDFNGDGISDIARIQSTVQIAYGDGQGRLGTAIDTGISGSSLAIGDFNRDGLSDFAIGGTGIGVVLNQGGGTFASVVTYAYGASSVGDLTIADFNGDGLIDIGGTGNTSAAGVWLGNGDGTFGNRLTLGGQRSNFAVGDFNGDGVPDVLTARDTSGASSISLGNATTTSNMQFIDLNTRQGALDSLAVIDAALGRINKETGNIGSSLSRLGSAVVTLMATRENYEVAKSRIIDADIAAETAQLTRVQIIQQTASAILAQANLQPQLVLSLLAK